MGEETKQSSYRRKVSTRVLSYFLAIAVLPVIIVSIILTNAGTEPLIKSAASNQQRLSSDGARQVDRYIDTLISQLELSASHFSLAPDQLDLQLENLMSNNTDLQKVEFLTLDRILQTATRESDGIRIASSTLPSSDNSSNNQGLSLMDNERQLIGVSHDVNNRPLITIGISVYDSTSTTNRLLGSIIGYYQTTNETWKSILPELDSDEKMYVVDTDNQLVYHPDETTLTVRNDFSTVESVRTFAGGEGETKQTVSAEKQEVLANASLTDAGWSVIIEQPVSSVNGAYISFVLTAITVTIVMIIATVLASILFTWRIASPVKSLLDGVKRLSKNDYSIPIEIKTNDELREMSETLNGLGNNISTYINSLQANNSNLSFGQSQLQSIINSVNDGIIAINARQEIVSINPSATRIVNHVEPPFVGRPLSEIFPWTIDGRPLNLDIGYSGTKSYEGVVLAKGESVQYMNLIVQVNEREDENVAAIITMHDQTATRELDFMKLDFVAIAAHELRTPLTVISGYLDVINREAIHSLSTENIEDLQNAIIGTQQLRELINKLLNIARIERGDMEIFLDKLNLTQMTATNVEQHQQIAAQKRQVLSFTSSISHNVFVPADPASITEVLNNLIGNAIKYTPDGGQIRVNITATSDEARVEVIDNGPGVPEELREKLFSKFYRAERSMITGTRGTGLGLFISKTVIELQRGTIGISPDQGRGGSAFYFTLPVYLPERDDALVTQNISRGRHGWFKKRTNN